MAENVVRIEGTVPTSPTGTQNVAVTGQPLTVTPGNTSTTPLFTSMAPNPLIAGTYVFSIGNIAATATANTYMSLFNPVGSGKTMFFGAAFISSEIVASSTNTEPMNLFRITAASAGTLALTTDIGKFQTAMPTPVGEIRTGNPTVTIGPQLANVPPPVGNQFTVGAYQVTVPAVAPPFILAPGEGVALRALAGDTDQRWNLSIVWSETA